MRPKTVRWLALGGATLLLAAVAVVIVTPPPNGYELSLYDAYPPLFWALPIGAMLLGGLAIIASVGVPDDRSWVFGLAVVLLTNALLSLLPFARGYWMHGRSDAMSHLGFVHDIAGSGEVGGNIYAPMHLLTLALAEATGTDPRTVAMVVPVVFSGLFFAGMFYLLVFVLDSRAQVLFGLPFAMLPVLRHAHLDFRPFDLSVMLVPLVLALFFKSQRTPTPAVRATFVLVLLSLLLYHPLTALFVIAAFSLYLAARYAPRISEPYATPTSLLSLSVAVYLAWYSNFSGVIRRFVRTYETLFGESEGEAPADAYTRTVEETSPELIDLLQIATISFGLEFVLFGLAFAAAGVTAALLLWGEYTLNTRSVLFLGTAVLFSLGGLSFLLIDLIVPSERPWQVAKIAAVVVTGQLFYLLLTRFDAVRSRKRLRIALSAGAVCVLLVLIVLSTFSLYQSPMGSESNQQVTQMEFEGAEWLTTHGSAADEFSEFGLRYYRFHDALYGTDPEPFPFEGRTPQRPPPDRFNYTSHDTLGESYAVDSYLLLGERGRVVYPETFADYPEFWRFTPADFERLEADHTVDRLYDNGDVTQYLVEGAAEASGE